MKAKPAKGQHTVSIQNKLPEGWGWTTLDKACLIIQGQSPESSTYNDKGKGVPFFQGKAEFGELYPSPVKWCTSPKKQALKGDILISVRAPVGPTNIAPFECCIGRGLAALRSRDGIDSKYILYNLRSQINEIVNMGTGSTFTAINGAQLKGIEIPLAHLDQQKLIVSEIEKQFSRLDEAVAALKRVRASLKRYKASVLKAAVEGKLTEEWRKQNPDVEPADKLLKRILAERKKKWEEANPKKKYKEPSAPDISNLPELPKGWVWATTDQISDFITKGTTPAASKLVEGNGEIQFLKVYNLTFDGKLNHKLKPAFVARTTHEGELARSMVQSGDILINIVGPPLGQVSIVPPDLPEANINQAIARFRPLDGVLKQYLVFTLMAKEVMGWAMKRAKTTAGQANLTLELCRALPVPLPPFAEQKEIINEVRRSLSVGEENEKIIGINLKRAERLRQAILKKAFSGRLVPQEALKLSGNS